MAIGNTFNSLKPNYKETYSMEHKPKLGSGERFKKLKSMIKKEGYSEKSAGAIAANAGRKAHGAKQMNKWAQAGKK